MRKGWYNSSGKLVAIATNTEYEALIDIELGLTLDHSPNHESVRWAPYLNPYSLEDFCDSWGITLEIDHENEQPMEVEKCETLEEFRVYLIQEFIKSLYNSI